LSFSFDPIVDPSTRCSAAASRDPPEIDSDGVAVAVVIDQQGPILPCRVLREQCTQCLRSSWPRSYHGCTGLLGATNVFTASRRKIETPARVGWSGLRDGVQGCRDHPDVPSLPENLAKQSKTKTKPTRGLEEARYAQAGVLTSSSLSLFARPRRMSYPKSKLVPRTTIHALARSQGKTDPS
jgi:hypothetical protein